MKYKSKINFLLESRLRILSYVSVVAVPIYLSITYFYLKLPFDFPLLIIYLVAYLPIVLTIVECKPIAHRPFLK